jgi:hypothetical protein
MLSGLEVCQYGRVQYRLTTFFCNLYSGVHVAGAGSSAHAKAPQGKAVRDRCQQSVADH